MKTQRVTQRIKKVALQILADYPDGQRYIELKRKIQLVDPTFNHNTINGSIWNLEAVFPEKVYKPSKGVFRLLVNKNKVSTVLTQVDSLQAETKIKESDFYLPFADWLKNDIEDVTYAIPLGGSIFKDKWGTPDVIGRKESQRSDLIKGLTEIVSAEIKTDTNQLITAFGQTCAYKLFSHKAYLVVPKQADTDELSRLDSLCQIFGIGLVTCDATNPEMPDFRILVRPSKQEPDLFYTNKYMALIEKELFTV